MRNERETIEYKGYNIVTFYDDCPFDPREDDNLGTMACFHKRYSLGDKVDFTAEDFSGWDEMEKHIRGKLKAVVVLPLYLYDHSMQSISTESFVGRAVHAEWDSGRIGFVYATKEDIRKNWMVKNVTKKLLKETERILKGEVAHYNDYIEGNVYGYTIEDSEGNTIESVGGYIGYDYYDEMVKEAKSVVDYTAKELEKEITNKVVLGWKTNTLY